MVKLTRNNVSSVQVRLFAVLILTSTLPLLGLGTFFAWSDAKSQRDFNAQAQLDYAEIASREISTLFNELRDDATLVASLPTITHGTPEERQLLLEQIFQNYDRYGQLAFVDPQTGDIQQSGAGKQEEIVNIAHIQSFQHAKEGRQSWVVAPPPLGGPLILHMHTPILRNGEIIGVLGSPVPMTPFRTIIERIVAHNVCDAQIADHAGTVFLDTERPQDPEGNEPRWPYLDQLSDPFQQSGIFIGDQHGDDELIAHTSVSQLEWTVIVKQPMEVILASSHRERNLTLIGVAFMAWLCLLIAYLFNRSITNPLQRLSSALAAFGRGHSVQNFEFNHSGIHEYEVLSTAFDRMRYDVMDRERRLAMAELANRSIINAIPDSLCRLDRSGMIIGHKLKPPFDTLFRLYSISVGQSVLDAMQKFAASANESMTWNELRRQVRTEQGARVEHLVVLPERQLFFECRIFEEKDSGYLVMLSDITERKRSEKLLQQAKQAAEDANRAKSSFLSHMTHELRTPMNGVIGMTSLLYDTNLNEEQLELVDNVRSSGDTLLTIINDILDFSKIEASKFELEKVDFELSSCIEEALDLVAAPAAGKELALVYQIDESVPLWISQDVTRLRQILVNLLNNAVKFTESGGVQVLVSAKPTISEDRTSSRKGTQPEQICLKFEIRDTGIGIPQDRLDRLFHSFSQADNSTARRYGGTGLGLVICKRLCEMMGGAISVESNEGEGSTFSFSIIGETSSKHLELSSALCTDLASKCIVVVDDNPLSQQFICNNLMQWGATVERVPLLGGLELTNIQESVNDFGHIEKLLSPPREPYALIWSRPIRTEADIDYLNEVKRVHPDLLMIVCTCHKNRLSKQHALLDVKTVTKPIKPSHLLKSLQTDDYQNDTSQSADRKILPEPTSIDFPAMRILLAEDNIVNQKVAIRILDRYGLSADVAANGLEVIAAIERQPYDVILMDVQMPEMDGLAATHEIRENQFNNNQPYIIAVTANAMNQDRETYLAQGMDDFVSKPIRIPELLNALRRAGDRTNADEYMGQKLPLKPSKSDPESQLVAREHTPLVGILAHRRAFETSPDYSYGVHRNAGAPQNSNHVISTEADDTGDYTPRLVYVSGGGHLPKMLFFNGKTLVRIGQNGDDCELVLNDVRVSQTHSTITKAGSDFYIRDEGSAGGTYVNYRRLRVGDEQRLNHNDVINFNEVEYRLVAQNSITMKSTPSDHMAASTDIQELQHRLHASIYPNSSLS